jgi:hypothetical protein
MLNDMLSGIGHLLKVALGNPPLLRDNTVAKSAGVDRTGFNSCVIAQYVGATSGAPDLLHQRREAPALRHRCRRQLRRLQA